MGKSVQNVIELDENDYIEQQYARVQSEAKFQAKDPQRYSINSKGNLKELLGSEDYQRMMGYESRSV